MVLNSVFNLLLKTCIFWRQKGLKNGSFQWIFAVLPPFLTPFRFSTIYTVCKNIFTFCLKIDILRGCTRGVEDLPQRTDSSFRRPCPAGADDTD